MDHAALYERFSIPDSANSQIATFTEQSMRATAQGQLRSLINDLGYSDPGGLSLGDNGLAGSLTGESQSIADSVIQTFNQMLSGQIDGLPADLSESDAKAALQDFFAAANGYNNSTLIPWAADYARNQATLAFYRQNGIEVEYDWMPGDPECAECQAMADSSPATQDEADADPPPLHRNCGCDQNPREPDPASLPDEGDLWDGSLTEKE